VLVSCLFPCAKGTGEGDFGALLPSSLVYRFLLRAVNLVRGVCPNFAASAIKDCRAAYFVEELVGSAAAVALPVVRHLLVALGIWGFESLVLARSSYMGLNHHIGLALLIWVLVTVAGSLI